MLSLRKRIDPLPSMPATRSPVYDQQITAYLPPESSATDFDFNLVRIVEEYGPKRLEQIDKEIKKHQDKIDALSIERGKVQALVIALT